MGFSRQALTCILVGSISALVAGGCGSDGAETPKDAGTGKVDSPSSSGPDTGSSPSPDTGSSPSPDTGSSPGPDTGSSPSPDTGSASPDTGSLPGPDGGSTGTTQALITAAAGGAVSLGGLKADFPAGALAADTTITVAAVDVSTVPTPSAVVGAVYDLGPNGTTLTKAVTLTFDLDSSKLANDEVAKIGFVKAGAWELLADSMTKDGKVVATTTHFTAFAVVKEKASTTPVAGCPAGVYTLISFKCNAQDITSVWKGIIPSTTLTFSSQGNACKMVLTNTATACKEIQEETFVFGAQGSHVAAGITSCTPAACKFNADDEPCMVGDRAKPSMPSTFAGFEAVNGQITIVTPANTGDLCGLAEGTQVFDLNPAGTVNPGPSKYTDNGNGTVTDSTAKLTWQKAVESTPLAWAAADAVCKGLTLAGGGWRLPTLAELKSLAMKGKNPSIDATFFPNTPGAKFWSSDPNGSSQHWYVDFQNGYENAGSVPDGLVRCVR
jgi:hypothetical protein